MDDEKIVWGEGTPWRTKAEFYSWLRGLLRRGWTKHPSRTNLIAKKRFKVEKIHKNGKKSLVYNCKCELCGHQGGLKDFQVDHIVSAGSLRNLEDIKGFIERLLIVSQDDLRIVCKNCNSIHAYADKNGVTFEEAKVIKEAISLVSSKKDKKWLENRGIVPDSTQIKRRKQIIKILSEEV